MECDPPWLTSAPVDVSDMPFDTAPVTQRQSMRGVLEIVLGIDNLVFIAILADKLPREQRDRARQIGPTLALLAMVRRGGCGARPTCISSSRSWTTSRW